MVQNSGGFGSKISARSWSSAASICDAATMAASSLRATSASAPTTSIGAIVPTSTRVRLSRSVWREMSSEAWATPRL